jgi:hypothetical protein
MRFLSILKTIALRLTLLLQILVNDIPRRRRSPRRNGRRRHLRSLSSMFNYELQNPSPYVKPSDQHTIVVIDSAMDVQWQCSFTEMLLSVTWHRRPTKSKVPLTNRGSHLHSCRWQGQWLTDTAEYYSIKKETAPVCSILDLRGDSINMTIFLYDCQRLHHTRCHA